MSGIVIPVTSDRNGKGVRQRMDGYGDGWANAHREELGGHFLLEDIDALAAVGRAGSDVQGFAWETEDRCFFEYAPDGWENRESQVRSFAHVAYFDRKLTEVAMTRDGPVTGKKLFMAMARVYASWQPVPPRFFYVVGGQRPPWTMYEHDIWTGDLVGEPVSLIAGGWPAIWYRLGLTGAKDQLRAWLQSVRMERAA